MRKPTCKNCPICGRYMGLCWAEKSDLIVKRVKIVTEEDRVAVFYCEHCNEFDTEDLTSDYLWEIYGDSIDFSEVSSDDAAVIRAELEEMRQAFLCRRYLAIPD
ncbi:MAG: hypothetical protein WCG99_02530 [Candidatus Berkelbacteria bacterium]